MHGNQVTRLMNGEATKTIVTTSSFHSCPFLDQQNRTETIIIKIEFHILEWEN